MKQQIRESSSLFYPLTPLSQCPPGIVLSLFSFPGCLGKEGIPQLDSQESQSWLEEQGAALGSVGSRWDALWHADIRMCFLLQAGAETGI